MLPYGSSRRRVADALAYEANPEANPKNNTAKVNSARGAFRMSRDCMSFPFSFPDVPI
jgi:hypothetical protein